MLVALRTHFLPCLSQAQPVLLKSFNRRKLALYKMTYNLRPRCIFTNFNSIDVAETFAETLNDGGNLWFGKMKENAANLRMITIAYCSVSYLFRIKAV